MNNVQALPALRPVDISPFRNDKGEVYFALQDHTCLGRGPLAVSAAGYFVLAHLDGHRSREDIQAAFRGQFGQEIAGEQIDGMVSALDEALLLDNERFARAYQQQCQAYGDSTARDNRARWADGQTLRSEVAEMLAGGQAESEVAPVAGIIAPHLDYSRGTPCYAAAYALLARGAPAERYVILGTNHFGRSAAVVATRKDFQTPLGFMRTDREFIMAIERRLGASVCEQEFDHQSEHSVELQVHILQVCLGDHSFEIVPVLCPDPCGPTGTAPADGRGPDLAAFADALGQVLAEDPQRTVLIAGADLSHVGQHFGEPEKTTPAFLQRVAAWDQRLLSMLERRREQAFVEAIRRKDNPTRICSAGCIYTLLRALPGRTCRLLRYHQAVNHEAETHVTCAAAVIG